MESMPPLQIIPVHLDAIHDLRAIAQQTFTETFAHQNTAEDMEKYLRDSLSVTRLSAELQDPNTFFFFALSGNDIAGYLKLNLGEAQTELKDDKALEIERIYVRKQFQGARVGKALFQKAVDLARARHASYIWLGVWEKNVKAIAFYEKQGFFPFGQHVFVLGNDPQTDIMMKLPLT